MINKKIVLSIGSATAIVAPIATVISCGYDDENNAVKKMLTSGHEGWIKFLNDPKNGFSEEFINRASVAIRWSKDSSEVKVIQYAFRGVEVPNGFKLPLTLTSIEEDAFSFAKLPEGFIIPESVQSIGASAFEEAKFKSDFTVPESLTIIGLDAFYGATIDEKRFVLSEHRSHPNAPEKHETSSQGAQRPTSTNTGTSSSLTNPIDDNDPTIIAPHKYAGQTIESTYKIPVDVTTIGEGAFEGATLPSGFKLPDTLKVIGDNAFAGVKLPDGFTIPDGVQSIGANAFGVRLVDIPQGPQLPSIWAGTGFEHTDIQPAQHHQKTELPSGFTIPPTVKTIGDYAFTEVTLPDGFTIPTGVKTIGVGAFKGAILPEGFTISEGVTSIGDSAFAGATGTAVNKAIPKSFRLPSTITEISNNLFNSAILPEGFRLPSNITSIGSGAFFVQDSKLPDGFTIPDKVASIGGEAFRQIKLPNSFKLPASLRRIDDRAFFAAKVPTNFRLPDGLEFIGTQAFGEVEFYNGFSIPSSVTTIKTHAFSASKLPQSFKAPTGPGIDRYAFA